MSTRYGGANSDKRNVRISDPRNPDAWIETAKENTVRPSEWL